MAWWSVLAIPHASWPAQPGAAYNRPSTSNPSRTCLSSPPSEMHSLSCPTTAQSLFSCTLSHCFPSSICPYHGWLVPLDLTHLHTTCYSFLTSSTNCTSPPGPCTLYPDCHCPSNRLALLYNRWCPLRALNSILLSVILAGYPLIYMGIWSLNFLWIVSNDFPLLNMWVIIILCSKLMSIHFVIVITHLLFTYYTFYLSSNYILYYLKPMDSLHLFLFIILYIFDYYSLSILFLQIICIAIAVYSRIVCYEESQFIKWW